MDDQSSFYNARDAVYSGRYEDAVGLIAQIPADFDPPSVLMLQADLAERTGQHEKADSLWAEAIRIGGTPYWCMFGRARAKRGLGQLREARDLIDRALSYPEAEKGGMLFAYDLHLRGGSYSQARKHAARLEIPPREHAYNIISRLTGMTNLDERTTLYDLARTTSGGELVDLGCWVGSLTIPMALGLEENSSAGRARIHAFDNFIWEDDFMGRQWSDLFPLPRPKVGGSFFDLFRHLTFPWSHLIRPVAGDLLEQGWDAGPIAILSVDAMKSIDLARHIMRTFYPHLAVGSYVYHQDFCCPAADGAVPLWWIHIYAYLLADHFEVAKRLDERSGLLFRTTKPISIEQVERVASHQLADAAVAERAFDYCLGLVPGISRGAIEDSRKQYRMALTAQP